MLWQGALISTGSRLPCAAGACGMYPRRIPLWWDMAVVVLFSFVIYYWAATGGPARGRTAAGHRAVLGDR